MKILPANDVHRVTGDAETVVCGYRHRGMRPVAQFYVRNRDWAIPGKFVCPYHLALAFQNDRFGDCFEVYQSRRGYWRKEEDWHGDA